MIWVYVVVCMILFAAGLFSAMAVDATIAELEKRVKALEDKHGSRIR
jgi:hypothetical protein